MSPFRHRRSPRECQSCGSSYTSRGKFFCSRKCAGSTIHGLNNTPLNYIWREMRKRCRNQNNKDYPKYGARGIKVCERWDSFEAFLEDMGPRPGPEYTLERENNDGNYEPTNCKWATRAVQSRNRRGVLPPAAVAKIKECKDIPLAALAAEFGCSESAVRRIRKGLSFGVASPEGQP